MLLPQTPEKRDSDRCLRFETGSRPADYTQKMTRARIMIAGINMSARYGEWLVGTCQFNHAICATGGAFLTDGSICKPIFQCVLKWNAVR